MLVLNNVKLCKDDNELLNSLLNNLFNGRGTGDGFYKVLKNKIKIYNVHSELVSVINGYGVLCKATKLENGKIWYSYGENYINNNNNDDYYNVINELHKQGFIKSSKLVNGEIKYSYK